MAIKQFERNRRVRVTTERVPGMKGEKAFTKSIYFNVDFTKVFVIFDDGREEWFTPNELDYVK